MFLCTEGSIHPPRGLSVLYCPFSDPLRDNQLIKLLHTFSLELENELIFHLSTLVRSCLVVFKTALKISITIFFLIEGISIFLNLIEIRGIESKRRHVVCDQARTRRNIASQ